MPPPAEKRQITMKFRTCQHATKAELFPAPPLKSGHVVGAGQTSGLAFLENGEVASLDMAFTWDSLDGKSGDHVNYSMFNFEDGSHFLILEVGKATESPDGNSSIVTATSISFLEGGGRFAGIEGTGTMLGRRFDAAGLANGNTYLDYTLTFTLPRA